MCLCAYDLQLARAYQELGKELSSTKIRLLGNYTLGKVIGEGAYHSGCSFEPL